MGSLRFAVAADRKSAEPAISELRDAVWRTGAIRLEPVFVPTYLALAAALEGGGCAAWTPPLVTTDLITAKVGTPLVTVGRKGRTSYYAVLLAREGSPFEKLTELTQATVGWVSKLSAAGYVVPRLYLPSLGLEPNRMFAKQVFLGSHDRVAHAIASGEVDVGATHASLRVKTGDFELTPPLIANARVLAAAGPIPGDVIFAGGALSSRLRDRLRGSLLAMQVPPDGPLARLMNVDRFEVPALGHFEMLRQWRLRAVESEPDVRDVLSAG